MRDDTILRLHHARQQRNRRATSIATIGEMCRARGIITTWTRPQSVGNCLST
ncbi:hypothetical protein ACVXG7_22300 [Enterobacter hormaechei]